MLSFAERPSSVWPFIPLVPLLVGALGTAEGAIVVKFLKRYDSAVGGSSRLRGMECQTEVRLIKSRNADSPYL